jgi:DNA-binding CsgD family transcriptional regulator
VPDSEQDPETDLRIGPTTEEMEGRRRARLRRRPSEDSKVLLGREAECSVLDEVIAAVHSGESATLVLRGFPGIGKTALLDYVVASASDLRLVRIAGVESEMELAFAALHQFCMPMLAQIEQLPSPQRDALRTVFGVSAGPPPDRFLVGLGVLSLISEVADERPLLCVVDDAQWLDHASAEVMAFAARRLQAESVAIVFAERELSPELNGLPELNIQGLADDDAGALLDSVVRFRLDEPVRGRIVAETRGNPLAILELPRGLSARQLATEFGLLGAKSLSGRIESSFLKRLAGLPHETQRFVLIAAAESTGNPLVVLRAAKRLGLEADAASAAETEGLLSIGDRLTFRHPLVRSAVYQASSMEDRRNAHKALAEVIDEEVDPDRRAWHLASAVLGLDEDVAAELERSAGRAQARGGLSAAAAFLQRSVELTRDPTRLTNRALAAARASQRIGAFDATLRLLTIAEAGAPDEIQSATAQLLRAQIEFSLGRGTEDVRQLLNAARRLEPLDANLARDTYLDAWGAALFTGPSGSGYFQEICDAVANLGPAPQPQRPGDVLLDGLVMLINQGRAAGIPILRQAVRAFARDDAAVDDGIRWGWIAITPSCALWDEEGSHAFCTLQVQRLRDSGGLEQLPLFLVSQSIGCAWRGQFGLSAQLIAEADDIKAATGARLAPYGALVLAAMRGTESPAVSMIETATRNAVYESDELAGVVALWGAAVLFNGLGRYREALAAAEKACRDPFLLHRTVWALPELVEASSRVGDFEKASNALERLAETTRPAGTDVGLGIEARSRALLSEGDIAEDLYGKAIVRLGRTHLAPDLARAHLLYGEWLRRQSRRTEARVELRTAYESFTTIGMEAFAERARGELLATGETVRKRSVETRDDLTPQEAQIARLAADRATNPEIATRLFISSKTVEYHLRKVFRKLGVTSRRQLAEKIMPLK